MYLLGGVVGLDIGTMGMVGVDMTDMTITKTEDTMKEDKPRAASCVILGYAMEVRAQTGNNALSKGEGYYSFFSNSVRGVSFTRGNT